jgi:hypothetical protein
MASSFFTLIQTGDTIDTGSLPGVGQLGHGPHLVHRLERVEIYLNSCAPVSADSVSAVSVIRSLPRSPPKKWKIKEIKVS